MTSDQLVAWLEHRLEAVGVKRVVPINEILDKAYRRAAMLATIQKVIDETYEEFDLDAVEVPKDLAEQVKDNIEDSDRAWDDAIWDLAQQEMEMEEA